MKITAAELVSAAKPFSGSRALGSIALSHKTLDLEPQSAFPRGANAPVSSRSRRLVFGLVDSRRGQLCMSRRPNRKGPTAGFNEFWGSSRLSAVGRTTHGVRSACCQTRPRPSQTPSGPNVQGFVPLGKPGTKAHGTSGVTNRLRSSSDFIFMRFACQTQEIAPCAQTQ